jgi:hypothetical protein
VNAPTVSDEEHLRAIRGRFRNPISIRIGSRLFALLLAFGSPITPIVLIRSRDGPVWPFTLLEWILLLTSVACFIAAIFVWRSADREYEFTGDEILERRRGVLRWRVAISALTDVRLERVKSGIWAHLYSGSQRYSVFLIPELRKQLLGPKT